eukprot:97127_1
MVTQLLFLALLTLALTTWVVAEAIVLDGRVFLSTSVMVEGEERALVPGTRVAIRFRDNRRMSASAGCNTMHSEAYFVDDDDILKFSDGLSGTEMGCEQVGLHEQDEIIVDLLVSQPKVVLEDDKLVLSSDAVTIVFLDREIADPDRSLVGTDWLENGFISKVFASKSNVDK